MRDNPIHEFDFDQVEAECCPKCGGEYRQEDCHELGCENGMHDVSDEFFETEGSRWEVCSTCYGHGSLKWCPSCGYDYNEENPTVR